MLVVDGQQRLTALLLGLGEGQLKDHLKLWVDLGCEPPAGTDLSFVLRISSACQPFGYQFDAPNEKQLLAQRRENERTWDGRHGPDRLE